tara:strand:+ start:387 stop:914 length:528 start_codon:yes stop_codon:yes gene_type:complete
MSNTHIMVDIETLGTSPKSVIFSIAAIKIKSNKIAGEFIAHPSIESGLKLGFKVQADTLKWWMFQDEEAREQITNSTSDLPTALNDLRHWMGPNNNLYLWGNGADFDNVHLAEAYKACKMQVPWRFWNSRCFRTLKETFPLSETPLQVGTKHHALNDALSQAHHLIQIFKDNALS